MGVDPVEVQILSTAPLVNASGCPLQKRASAFFVASESVNEKREKVVNLRKDVPNNFRLAGTILGFTHTSPINFR